MKLPRQRAHPVRWALIFLIPVLGPALCSCAVVAPAAFMPSWQSSLSLVPVAAELRGGARRPGDEVRVDGVPSPSAPDKGDYSGVMALESLTHYWGDPTDWRDIAGEILSAEGGATLRRDEHNVDTGPPARARSAGPKGPASQFGSAVEERILAYLDRSGYAARLKQSSFDAIRGEIQCGRPVLLFLECEPGFTRRVATALPGYERFLITWMPKEHRILLLVGYDTRDEYFLCHSGKEALSVWRHDELDRCWSRTSHAAIFVAPFGPESGTTGPTIPSGT